MTEAAPTPAVFGPRSEMAFPRPFAAVVAASLALTAACTRSVEPQATPGAAPKLNFVLVTLDTTRADHMGCYGYQRGTSPHMDQLASDGVRFETCYSTAGLTPVAHASIFTGLNPYQHGLRVMYASSGCSLPTSVHTLATVLQQAGWRTGAFVSAFPVSEVFGFDRGFDTWDNGLGQSAAGAIEVVDGVAGWDLEEFQRRSDRTTDRAVEWLDEVDEPFFLWMHYWDPHDRDVLPPEEFVQNYLQEHYGGVVSETSLYDAEIAFVDAQLGRLIDHVERSGAGERTVYVLTADHGQGLGEHDWAYHRLLYQEQIHLPLLIRDPRGPRGLVVPHLVRNIDIYPTALELLGVASPSPVEGQSLVPLLRGEPDAPRLAYADQLNKWDTNARMLKSRPQDDLLHCIVDGTWKLIYRPLRAESSELYDLAGDPDEAHNVFLEETAVAERLVAELERRKPWVLEDFGPGSGDERTMQALKELGYMGDDEEEDEELESP